MRRIADRIAALPLRVRLALAATALLPLALAVVFGLVFLRFEQALNTTIDGDLRSRAGALAPLVARRGPPAIRTRAATELLAPQGAWAQLADRGGHVVASSREVAAVALLAPAQAREAAASGWHGDRRRIPSVAKRSRLVAVPVPSRGLVLVVGRSLRGRESANESFGRALLIGGPLSLILSAAACYIAAAAALRPVDAMRVRAERISAEDTGARLPVPPADDEIARLGRTLNEMLARLERAHAQQRELVQNASHELRTPLATLSAEIELALTDPDATPAVRQAMSTALWEAHRVARLADDLLVLAQLEDHGIPVARTPQDVDEVLHAIAGRFARRAAEDGRSVTVDAEPAVAPLDVARIEQAVGNLIDNSLRHGAGDVLIRSRVHDGQLRVSVRDDGPGIDSPLRESVFARFSRGPTAAPGAGLGLSIAASIAKAHGGDARADGDGFVVLTLATTATPAKEVVAGPDDEARAPIVPPVA